MGAAEQQQFTQYPYKYGDGLRGAAIAQTRNGKDELITPVALWELDNATGLYLPPGLSANPRKPRVEATLTGSIVKRTVIQGPGSGISIAPGESFILLDRFVLSQETERWTIAGRFRSGVSGGLMLQLTYHLSSAGPSSTDRVAHFVTNIDKNVVADSDYFRATPETFFLNLDSIASYNLGPRVTLTLTNTGTTTEPLRSCVLTEFRPKGDTA